MIRACNFIPSGGMDTWGDTNVYTGQLNILFEVGIFVRSGGCYNLVVLENTYDGNILITNKNTNLPPWIAPDGLVYFEQEGNAFIARNFITNYALEAVQLSGGPNSVVGNTFHTLVSHGSCAHCAPITAPGRTDWQQFDRLFDLFHWQLGLRRAVRRKGYSLHASICHQFLGNTSNLYLPFDSAEDWPGAAAWVQSCQAASVCGNTLVAGSHGFYFTGTNANAMILNNSFGPAAYRGIGYVSGSNSLSTAQISGNTLVKASVSTCNSPTPTASAGSSEATPFWTPTRTSSQYF